MNFAVTGGAGFIGSHIVKYLISQGNSVTVIDNLLRGKMENLEDVKDKIEFLKMSILNFDDLRNALKNTDGVFHQAALTSVPESFTKEDEYRRVNIDGTENIFKIAKEFDIKVVYASSSSVYGNPKKIPIFEDFERKPINPYGVTKIEDEFLAEKYDKSGVKIIVLRYFNVYGKGQTLDYAGVITKFLENIMIDKPPIIFGDGSQIRDFIFVQDVAKANLAAMNSSENFGFFNVGTGKSISIKQLAQLMIKLSGKSLEPNFDKLPDGDIHDSEADTTLSEKLLSWKAETPLEEGLKTIFE